MNNDQLKLVDSISKQQEFSKDAIIFEENSPSQEFFIILDGEVEIQVVSGLELGWNLVSFQVLPSDRSPESVLGGLTQGGSGIDLAAAVDSLISETRATRIGFSRKLSRGSDG